MNKKVSTLLTVALTLGGSLLSSSAFAENIRVTEAEESATYLLQAAKYHDGTNWQAQGGNYYVSLNSDGTYYLTTNKDVATLWSVDKVTSSQGIDYSFIAVNGGNKFTVKVGENGYSSFSVVDDVTADVSRLDFKVQSTQHYVGHDETSGANNKIVGETLLKEADGFQLVEVEAGEIGDSDLNKLFNKKGFNFAVKPDVKDAKVEGNLFGGDELVWAFEVKKGNVKESTNWTAEGYKLSENGANGKDLIIPAGIYFFKERVLNDNKGTAVYAEDIDWSNSTLIAVSQKETVETTTEERKNGQGFKLAPVKGSEFVFEKNTSDFKIGHLPIYNACFNVKDNHMANKDYPYEISLSNFYYQASVKDTDDKALSKAATKLGSLTFTDSEVEFLATVAKTQTSSEYIFKFSDSAILDGKSLLKTTKEAAVYNIKFVEGLAQDKALFGKYLTNGVSGTDFIWEAKGSDIAKLDYPSFQYTITKVAKDGGDKYVNVTFTNRETNEGFTLKLFPEGENRYSVAIVDADATTSNPDGTLSVQPVKIVSNSYAVINDGPAKTVNEDLIIELIPATVNEYAGFANLEDKSVRTIRFARDKYDTSNQWFVGVEDNKLNNKTFVEEVYDAAQFQFVKVESKASTIARTFVYNNETTKTVDDVHNGDKVSAYKYNLRYVEDGTETGYYLYDSNGVELSEQNKTDFYVKENADGSVSLFGKDGAFATSGIAGQRVTKPEKNTSVAVTVDNKGVPSYITSTNRASIYANVGNDHTLRMYLESEIPNLSWKAENGHVTLQNATGLNGNYITMNENREGILLNEAGDAFYLHVADKNAIVPSFFISKGKGEGSNAASERMFMFNPTDSVKYQVNRPYDPNYELAAKATKVLFKAGTLNATADTMSTVIKNEKRNVAMKADNDGTWAGLNRFKFQLIGAEDTENSYYIRQVNGAVNGANSEVTAYVASNNEKLYFTTDKDLAMTVDITSVDAPTSNEGVAASEVKVVAQDGAVVVKNAAGKNVVVSTILGQVVANEVLTSDNATINVPAGIVVVAVEGESFKVNVK